MSSEAIQSKGRAYRSFAGAALMAILQLAPWGGFSVFMMPLCNALNQSMATISLCWTFSAIGGLVGSLLIGTMLKKLGIRFCIILGTVTYVFFFLSVANAKSLPLLFIAASLHGIGATSAGFACAQVTVTSWFDKSRATMLSLLSVCMAAGSAIIVPVIASQISARGYQATATGIAIIGGVGILIAGLLLISDHPSKYGMKPWGYVEREATAEDAASRAPLKVSQMAKFAPFWIVVIIAVLASMASQAYNSQSSNFYQSIGLDPVSASLVISISTAFGIVWNLLFGRVSDKKGTLLASLINGLVYSIAMLLSFLFVGWTGAIIAGICFSASASMTSLMAPTTMTSLFGNKEAGNLIGFARAGASIGSMVAAPISGAIFDATGSYVRMFQMSGVFLIVALILMFAVNNKKTKANMAAKAAELTKQAQA